MFGTNLKNYCERNLKTASIVFSVILTFIFTSYAQNINDDLKPKTANPKTANPKTANPKTKTFSKTAKRSVKPAAKRKITQTSINRRGITAANPVYAETSDQIINRFMDYNRSAGVTSKDWTSVVNQAQKNLRENPNNAAANAQLLIAQGQIAYLQRNYSNALTQFNAAARVLPSSALPFYCIGKVYIVTRQPDEAKENFEKAIDLNEKFALAYRGLADVMSAQGKGKKAQEYNRQAARIGLPKTNSSAAVNNSNAARERNSQFVRAAAKVSPYDSELKKAKNLTARKSWQNSLKILQPLSANNPTAEIFVAIGNNYFGMEQWLSAQQAYRKAVELDPNSAAALYKLGTVMFEVNEYQAAADAFEKSLILDQNGATINRQTVRKMADKANEKAQELKNGKKKKFLGIGFNFN